MNMKTILRLMGTLALTTGATTTVVACGNKSNPTATINAAVSKQLGLTTDDAGKTGTQVAKLDTTTSNNDVTWTIDALATAITADKLLTSDNKAVNQACYDFITGTLKIKPTTGTKLSDGIFDKNELTAIKGDITNIKPTLTKTSANNDYAITAGTFNFRFRNGATTFGSDYTVKLKTDATVGVIATTLGTIVEKLVITDTDVVTNNKILFVKDGAIPTTAVKGTVINITGTTTEFVKQFNALNKLTALKITAQFESTDATGTWAEGKKLIISYKTTTVNFDAATVKTTLTVS